MLLLRDRLEAAGIEQTEERVHLFDLPGCDGMILCNSRGWAPVSRVGSRVNPLHRAFARR
jgi:branched-subunit amino acid aminotransferase/4-amino-4-deoxychorismate lyase